MRTNRDVSMSRPVDRVVHTGNSFSGVDFLGFAVALALTFAAVFANAVGAAELPRTAWKKNPLLHTIAVFGKDERRPLSRAQWALSSKIGVLHDPRTRSVCTAFCVAPDVVATAAHCLYRTSGEKPLRL